MDSIFKDKTLLITGGTGSFGNTVLKHFLSTFRGMKKNRTTCATTISCAIRTWRAS